MATDPNEAAFNDQFCARVKRLREEKSWTAEEMAIALGIPPDRYRSTSFPGLRASLTGMWSSF